MSDLVQELEMQVAAADSAKDKVALLNRLALELSHRSERNLPKAVGLMQYAQALLLEVNDPLTTANVHNTLGIIYGMMGEAKTALDKFDLALDTFRHLGRLDLQSAVLRNSSQIFVTQGDAEQALNLLAESFTLARQSGSLTDQAATLAKIASIRLAQGEYLTAQQGCRQSRQLYRDAGDEGGEAEVQVLMGDIALAMGESERAVDCYQVALRLAQKMDRPRIIMEALFRLGEFYRLRDQPSEAEPFLKNACALAEDTGHQRIHYQSHHALALVHQQLRDYENALFHFQQFYQLKEEINVQEAQSQQKNLEMLYQEEMLGREAEIDHLKNVILQDEIQKRQEIEQELIKANEKLIDEAASREQLIEDLNAFASMVAHDLKNPLTNIALTAGVLRMSMEVNNDKTGLAAAERLAHQVEKINRIINELLVLASVRKEDVELAPLDMFAILREVETRLDRLIKEHRPEIRKPASWPSACGHAPWIEEIWENYISNAIHYGGHPPVVELGAQELENGMVRFWVKDNGKGLDERAQQRLFAIFNRTNTTRISGHGLGLSIVKRIVDKLGGQVGVETEGPGQGCTFYFTLPAEIKHTEKL